MRSCCGNRHTFAVLHGAVKAWYDGDCSDVDQWSGENRCSRAGTDRLATSAGHRDVISGDACTKVKNSSRRASLSSVLTLVAGLLCVEQVEALTL